jgi:transmembrane sensor
VSSGKAEQDQNILSEAAAWLVLLQDGPLNQAQQQDFEQWKNQSPQHQQIWRKAEQLQARLSSPTYQIGKAALAQAQQIPKSLGKLGLILGVIGVLASVAYWGQQQAWLAGYRTAYGQQQQIQLADGTQIQLNAHTAIDVDYSTTARKIILHYGEIYVKTGHETHYRPFWVEGRHGVVQALGTEFDVKQQTTETHVAVLQHAVKIRPQHAQRSHLLQAGLQLQYDQHGFRQPQPLQQGELLWKDGLMLADQVPLAQFAKKIEQYYNVKLYVSADCRDILISGTYSIHQLQHLLAALQQTYALNIQSRLFGQLIFIS